MPYLTQLQGQFTKIVIKNVSTLKSVYSIRLYELLMQFKVIGDRLISINDFRSMLGLDEKIRHLQITESMGNKTSNKRVKPKKQSICNS